MFSKIKSSALLILVVAMQILACARESAPSNPAIDVKLKGDGECLNEFGEHLERYFKGRMSRAEVVQFWDCTGNAVREYQRLTAGDTPEGHYTPQALRRFLYRYFIKTKPLDDTLLAHLMELKRVLLSGSVSEITHAELARLNELIVELKLLSLELYPHVLVLFGQAPASDEQVLQAARAFDQAMFRLGRWLDGRREPYTFQQLKGLIADLKEWLNGRGAETLDRFEKVLEILPAAKGLLLAGRTDRIEGESWLALTRLGGQGFRLFLYFQKSFHAHLNDGLYRGLMPEAISELAEILDVAIQRRGVDGIPLADWDLLFERLEHSTLFPKEVSADAMGAAFRWLVIRTLGEGKETSDLTLGHLRVLREKARIWRELHRRESGEKFDVVPEMAEFDAAVSRSLPMTWDSEGRLIHNRNGALVWTSESRRRMVWPFVLLHWVKRGYIGAKSEMDEDEISLAVQEILPMLQKFGWMSDTKLSIGKRILREADLFTNASNGNFKLDLAEATRYLAFVASGLRVAEIWLGEADLECGGRDAACVRRIATQPESRALEALPYLRALVLKSNPEFFVKYMEQAEETVLDKVTLGTMSTKNILQAWQLFQYVETFLAIYDADGSENINLVESEPAFDRYGPTLAKLLRASHMPSEEIWAFFTFMMKYGNTPFGMFGGQILFNHWKWHRNDWVFAAERQTLMGILNQLSKL